MKGPVVLLSCAVVCAGLAFVAAGILPFVMVPGGGIGPFFFIFGALAILFATLLALMLIWRLLRWLGKAISAADAAIEREAYK